MKEDSGGGGGGEVVTKRNSRKLYIPLSGGRVSGSGTVYIYTHTHTHTHTHSAVPFIVFHLGEYLLPLAIDLLLV